MVVFVLFVIWEFGGKSFFIVVKLVVYVDRIVSVEENGVNELKFYFILVR